MYEFNKYKTSKNKNKYSLTIQNKNLDPKEFEILKESIYLTRDLINEPPIEVNPESMEKIIKKTFKKKIQIEIIK
jgi:leucyl aminopeptidase